MFSPWSNRLWATLSRKKNTKKHFFGGVGIRRTLKKGYTIFFFMDVLLPKKHLQNRHHHRRHKNVPESAKFLLWSIRRTDAEAQALILQPPDAKSRFTGKDPDAGKDWGQEEKGATEDEMVGWHHRFNGHELGQTPGESEGQGSQSCCSLWGRKESETTWRLNNNQNAIRVKTRRKHSAFCITH